MPEGRRSRVRGCLLGGAVGDALGVPITAIAEEVTGMVLPANVTALGVFQGAFEALGEEGLAEAVAARVPAKARDANLEAFRAGVARGKAAQAGRRGEMGSSGK